MLEHFIGFLQTRPDHSLLERFTFFVVPHVNPDGDERNLSWWRQATETVPLGPYLRDAVREPPGDDVEFGFPHDADDHDARPENRAVARFLEGGAPFMLHATFHGMAWGMGPWYLIEESWIDRSRGFRDRLRARSRDLGYRLHDVDRGGDKGFTRIDEGFTTRPDSRAMRAFFLAQDDPEMAVKFRPSSMEYVRGLGGDPFTFVTEMPLFILPVERYRESSDPVRPLATQRLRAAAVDDDTLAKVVDEVGLQAMPIRDQMTLQLAILEEALDLVAD